MKPQLVILTGPNGAGKSTFYEHFLSSSPLPFLNADVAAKATGLSAFEAARLVDTARDRMIGAGLGFITETVFSDPEGHKLAMLRRAVKAGYDVTLIYIGVEKPDLLQRRVDVRVARGGHDVPRDKVAARFARSLENLAAAIDVVQTVELYDNSSEQDPYLLVATFQAGTVTHRMRGRLPVWARALARR